MRGSEDAAARVRAAVRRTSGLRVVGGLLALAALTGCGIRATSVPVDAGPAPSRVACAEEGGAAVEETGSPQTSLMGELRIWLVCSGRVIDVGRKVELPQDGSLQDRLVMARTLLAELRREPSEAEQKAGFDTTVPADLEVSGPDTTDDDGVLRLSRHPNELPGFALAQIVCTYANTPIRDTNRQVLLGGPNDEPTKPLKLYECGTALRTTVEAAETAGVPF